MGVNTTYTVSKYLELVWRPWKEEISRRALSFYHVWPSVLKLLPDMKGTIDRFWDDAGIFYRVGIQVWCFSWANYLKILWRMFTVSPFTYESERITHTGLTNVNNCDQILQGFYFFAFVIDEITVHIISREGATGQPGVAKCGRWPAVGRSESGTFTSKRRGLLHLTTAGSKND